MNFYKRYMGDFARDTAHLTLIQRGAYNELLDYYYSTEKPLPVDKQALYRIAKAMNSTERKAVDEIVEQYFPVDGDGLRHNGRADKEIANHSRQVEINRELGKKGGRPKTESKTESVSENKPNTEPNREPNDNPNHSQIPEPEKRTSPPSGAKPDAVKEEIWNTGKTILQAEGLEKDRAGSFLGKLCKDYGQVLVLQAVRDCATATPAKPSEWLVARCQERRANSGNKQVQLENRNRKATEGWKPPELRNAG